MNGGNTLNFTAWERDGYLMQQKFADVRKVITNNSNNLSRFQYLLLNGHVSWGLSLELSKLIQRMTSLVEIQLNILPRIISSQTLSIQYLWHPHVLTKDLVKWPKSLQRIVAKNSNSLVVAFKNTRYLQEILEPPVEDDDDDDEVSILPGPPPRSVASSSTNKPPAPRAIPGAIEIDDDDDEEDKPAPRPTPPLPAPAPPPKQSILPFAAVAASKPLPPPPQKPEFIAPLPRPKTPSLSSSQQQQPPSPLASSSIQMKRTFSKEMEMEHTAIEDQKKDREKKKKVRASTAAEKPSKKTAKLIAPPEGRQLPNDCSEPIQQNEHTKWNSEDWLRNIINELPASITGIPASGLMMIGTNARNRNAQFQYEGPPIKPRCAYIRALYRRKDIWELFVNTFARKCTVFRSWSKYEREEWLTSGLRSGQVLMDQVEKENQASAKKPEPMRFHIVDLGDSKELQRMEPFVQDWADHPDRSSDDPIPIDELSKEWMKIKKLDEESKKNKTALDASDEPKVPPSSSSSSSSSSAAPPPPPPPTRKRKIEHLLFLTDGWTIAEPAYGVPDNYDGLQIDLERNIVEEYRKQDSRIYDSYLVVNKERIPGEKKKDETAETRSLVIHVRKGGGDMASNPLKSDELLFYLLWRMQQSAITEVEEPMSAIDMLIYWRRIRTWLRRTRFSFYKSLLQKSVRFCPIFVEEPPWNVYPQLVPIRVTNPEIPAYKRMDYKHSSSSAASEKERDPFVVAGTDPNPIPTAKRLTRVLFQNILLLEGLRHPGEFNPQVHQREYGIQLLKRLAVIGLEDSIIRDPRHLTHLLAVSLLKKRVPLWYPTPDLISKWLDIAQPVFTNERYRFEYVLKKKDFDQNLTWYANDSPWNNAAALLLYVKSLESDYIMFQSVASIVSQIIEKRMDERPQLKPRKRRKLQRADSSTETESESESGYDSSSVSAFAAEERVREEEEYWNWWSLRDRDDQTVLSLPYSETSSEEEAEFNENAFHRERVLPESMSITWALDQHCATGVMTFLDPSVVMDYPAVVGSQPYGQVANQLFKGATGLNPRRVPEIRTKLKEGQFVASVLAAQRLYWLAVYGGEWKSMQIENLHDSTNLTLEKDDDDKETEAEIPFQYELHRSWIAGGVGHIPVEITDHDGKEQIFYVMLDPNKIEEFFVIPKPIKRKRETADVKDTEEDDAAEMIQPITDKEQKDAVKEAMKVLKADAGRKWTGCAPPILEWEDTLITLAPRSSSSSLSSSSASSPALVYYIDEKYVLTKEVIRKEWDQARQLNLTLTGFLNTNETYVIESEVLVNENTLRVCPPMNPSKKRRNEIHWNAWRKLDTLLNAVTDVSFDALRRLHFFLASKSGIFEIPAIGRDGSPTADGITTHDSLVYQTLLRISQLFPAAFVVLNTKGDGKTPFSFKTILAPLKWKIAERVKKLFSSNTESSSSSSSGGGGERVKENPLIRSIKGSWPKEVKPEYVEEGKDKKQKARAPEGKLSRVVRPMEHQIKALEYMNARYEQGQMASGEIMGTGTGKTLPVIYFVMDLIQQSRSRRQPMFVVHTAPAVTVASITRQWKDMGFTVEQVTGLLDERRKHKSKDKRQTIKPFVITIIEHDHLRYVRDYFPSEVMDNLFFIADEVHKMLNESLRTDEAMWFATNARIKSIITATPNIDSKPEKIFPWEDLLSPFEVTTRNWFVAYRFLFTYKYNFGKTVKDIQKVEELTEVEMKEFKTKMPIYFGGNVDNGRTNVSDFADINRMIIDVQIRGVVRIALQVLNEPDQPAVMIVTPDDTVRDEVARRLIVEGKQPPESIIRVGGKTSSKKQKKKTKKQKEAESESESEMGEEGVGGGEQKKKKDNEKDEDPLKNCPILPSVEWTRETHDKTKEYMNTRVLITTMRRVEGFNATYSSTMVTSVWPGNEGTLTQVRGRILRIDQEANIIRYFTVVDSAGYLTKRQNQYDIPKQLNATLNQASRSSMPSS